jgi:predicted ATPase/DNA-binding SARP family transcriptional activator
MLGELRVIQGDRIHTRFRTHKAAALLAYLALHLHQTHARERLVDIFWPDMEMEDGRNNLSTALAQLRPQLEPSGVPKNGILIADRQNVRLNPEAVTTDVSEFECLLKKSERAQGDERICLMESAVAIYRGELLPGVYEDWATYEQVRLQTLFAQTLRELGGLLEEKERWEAALTIARRAAQAEPFEEEPYQAQMRLYARLSRPAAALEVFQQAERLFRKELGVSLSAETRALADALKRDPRALLPSKKTVKTPPPVVTVPAPALPPERTAPTLPLQLTRFFGREQEAEQLETMLQTPEMRLVTLLGPGGAGKTRLAVEVARRLATAFSNRVWFVGLADLPDASLMLAALIRALKLPPDSQVDPLERVAQYLGDAPCLLVMDNYEHLLSRPWEGKNDGAFTQGAAALTRMLLERVPNLTVLATSRVPLRLGGEREFPLLPLSLPEEAQLSPEKLLQFDSVALYADRAQSARPEFALNVQNAASVVALCRRLEGMPLAIEMAAAWTKTIPPARMLERLEKQLDMLVSRRRDLPARHQSLRATIEWSYALLDPELRQDFVRLSVFRGGWTLEAAEAICGDHALHALLALQEHSLILEQERGDGEPRYRMLEPLREFGQEKLAEEGELSKARLLHLNYFRSFANRANEHCHRHTEKEWMARIAADLDNVRAALQFSLSPDGDARAAVEMCGKLWWFWAHYASAQEGRLWTSKSLAAYAGDMTVGYAEALNGAGTLALNQGDLEEARERLERCVQVAEILGEVKLLLAARNNLAIALYDRGNFAEARRSWRENLELARANKMEMALAITLSNLGEMDYDAGDYDSARALMEESLVLRRQQGSHYNIGRILMLLSKTACQQKQLADAEHFLREGLTLLMEAKVWHVMVDALEIASILAIRKQRFEEAVTLLSFADAYRERETLFRPPNETNEYQKMMQQAKTVLDPDICARCAACGREMTVEEAFTFAQVEVLGSNPSG